MNFSSPHKSRIGLWVDYWRARTSPWTRWGAFHAKLALWLHSVYVGTLSLISPTLRQASISVLLKKGQEVWSLYPHTVSYLMEEDSKVRAKASARPLERLLPTLISGEQTGGTSIWMFILTFNLLKRNNRSTWSRYIIWPVSITVFDGDDSYLLAGLPQLGFGESLISWI